jgi:glycosyltransferase involved in cell wall biosynthesis
MKKNYKILITWRLLVDDILKFKLLFKKNNIHYDIVPSFKIFSILHILYSYNKIIFTMGPGNGTYFLTFLLSLLRSPEIFWIASRPMISFSIFNCFLYRLKNIYFNTENLFLNKIISATNCNARKVIIGFNKSRLNGSITEANSFKKKILHRSNFHKPTLVHVGHCNKKRGLEVLVDIKKEYGGEVNIVFFSSKINFDTKVADFLRTNNIIVYTGKLKNISLAYQIADIYIFTVDPKSHGSTDLPLTVLEALHMETPVLTTKLKSLTELFSSNKNVFFFEKNNISTLLKKILLRTNFNYSHKLEDKFYIENFTNQVIKDLQRK